MRLIQINLQTHFGGGEVYTSFLCRALSLLGLPCQLIVHQQATFWDRLALPDDTELVRVAADTELRALLPDGPLWLLAHGPMPAKLRAAAPDRLRTAIVHMPVQGRNPQAYAGHDMLFAVSGWVREGLEQAGLPVWSEPLYGVADVARAGQSSTIRRASRYDWDRRKFRDRVLSWLEPAWETFRPHPEYERRPGLTVGVVSRITPIKQFPALFTILAPILARHRNVNLEIFGAGGYASVRDLDAALQPLAGHARFWGHQADVASVYRSIDCLLTGLPEKEALGLNVIEAQSCGVPVIAPHAPPFIETVLDGVTGFFYRDPRQDQGADFARLIERLLTSPLPDPRAASVHLHKFSFAAFTARLTPIIAWAQNRLGSTTAIPIPTATRQKGNS